MVRRSQSTSTVPQVCTKNGVKEKRLNVSLLDVSRPTLAESAPLRYTGVLSQNGSVSVAKGIGFFRSILLRCDGEKAARMEVELTYHLRRICNLLDGRNGAEIRQVCLNRKLGGGQLDISSPLAEIGLLLLIGDSVRYIDTTYVHHIFTWAPESISPRSPMLSRQVHLDIASAFVTASTATVAESICNLNNAVIRG
mmetsp:Transcript_25741/g.42267  ORF Transcript_25741/g.42267 Transcript_25741/m.42267 type:complete len:196 (+) Transcript_25741:228-815(+)